MASSGHLALKTDYQGDHQVHTDANVEMLAGGSKNSGDGGGGGGGDVSNAGQNKGGGWGKESLVEDNNSPVSMTLSMSPVHSPQVVAAPLRPVQSVVIELDDLKTWESYQTDQESSSIANGLGDDRGSVDRNSRHGNKLRDALRDDHPGVISYEDKVDESNEAAESSDCSGEASTQGMKSPYVDNYRRYHKLPLVAQSNTQSFDAFKTAGSPKNTEEGEWGTDCGSSVWSAFDTGIDNEGASDGYDKGKMNGTDWDEEYRIVDSPTLGAGFAAHRPHLLGSGWPMDSDSPTSPNPTVNTIATVSTSARAERNLNVPFLPSSLWLHGNSVDSTSGEKIKENTDVESKEPVSVFEDESTDEEFPTKATVHKAIQKRFTRPAVVKRGTASVVVGLKEMLWTTGPRAAKSKPGPSKGKLAKLTGEDIWLPKRSNEKRAGVVGLPAAEPGDLQTQPSKVKNDAKNPVGMGIQQDSTETVPDGLRSNPVRRAATVPSRKKVTFPPPQALEIGPEHRFLRQTIVSTPYPTRLTNGVEENSGPTNNNRREALLTLVLFNPHTRVPLTKKLVIPGSQGLPLEDTSEERKPKIMAILKVNFDDEKLAKLTHKEYVGMRGFFRSTFSARNVQDVKIFFYHTTSDLIDRIDSPSTNPFTLPANRNFGEAQMLALYRKPRFGRRKQAWVDWIANLPENSTSPAPGTQRLALQLVEGWCIWKIASSLLAVLAVSIAATLLWIFLGTGGVSSSMPYMDATFDPGMSTGVHNSRISHAGFRGAGGRVQSGALLGTLILMLGWTGTGAWILLSWLT